MWLDDLHDNAEKAIASSTGWWSPDELRDLDPERVRALCELAEAAQDLYERVQMDESVGICLSERATCLILGDKLAALTSLEPAHKEGT